jgi:hypothetical protein
VQRDRILLRFGENAWTHWGIDVEIAPFVVLLPLLTQKERNFVLMQLRGMVDRRRKTFRTTGGKLMLRRDEGETDSGISIPELWLALGF